jgi:glycosyltransferase involved in cell wall biosynthesis
VRPLNIAYISEAAPQDRHAWSGTVHYTYKSLCDAGFNVITLGPARPRFWRYFLAGLNQLSLSVFKKRLDYRHSVRYSKEFGRIFTAKLKTISYDIVLVCGNTECGAYIKTDKPIYYVLDRTIAGALNYHQILKDLWDFSREQSVITDRKAMTGAHKLIFSSNWAAAHAKEYYGIPVTKTAVFPFGANLDSVPARELVLAPKSETHWTLLLIGSDWINKGADIAFNTFKLLKAKKLPVKLTIVGCTPPEEINDKDVTVIPFIDKNTKEGMKQITDLFLAHHFFILPTRFDCTPIVFCEASAFGVPVLSSDTGGVRGHVTEGVNGFLIPYEDKGELYAKKIMELTQDRARYAQLRVSTRDLYESSLNWEAWGRKFRKLAEGDLTQ